MENIKFEQYPLHVPSLKIIEKKIVGLTEELKSCGSALTALPVIKKMNKFMDEISSDMTIISVRYQIDTTNTRYAQAQNKLDEISPVISAYLNNWNKVLVKLRCRKDLEKTLGKYYFKMIETSLKVFDEKIVPELIEQNRLTSEYSRILASAKIEFDGQILNLSQMGKYTQHKDRTIRKAAAIAVDKWMGENEEAIGEIYDKLVKLRHQMALKLGYKNYIELGYLSLGRLDYNAKDVKGYRKQIEETVVPVCNKLYKRQAKRLGLNPKTMQAYDYNVSFLSGNPTPAGDADYLVKTATNMYDDMSKETKEFFHFMLDNHLMDLLAKPGKAPGGFMTYIPRYKAPFIFANFNGSKDDVDVLTHEVGHALQGYLSSKIKVPEYRSPTLEACEIHSMSMEFFAYPYMNKFFGKDEQKYLYSHLEGAVEFLPYGVCVDEFQHWVYENPNATHEDRCAKWKELEARYTPHKRFDDQPTFKHGATWIRQSHIINSPFYYIDYTLAQVCAMQFFVEMNKNRDKAWKKYIKLCKCGGQYPFVELLEKNKLRNPFLDGNVAKVIKPVSKVLASYDDSEF